MTMTIPISLMSEGYDKTIFMVRDALEKRLKNINNRLPVTPTFHRGAADPLNLPNDPVGVWLDWERMTPDSDQPFGASTFVSHWVIEVVANDDGNDTYGGESDLGTRVFGAVLRTLTETQDDLGLDGTIDYFPDPRILHTRGTIPGTTRKIEAFTIQIEAHMQMQFVRLPP